MGFPRQLQLAFQANNLYLTHSKSVLSVMVLVWMFAYVAPLGATFFFNADTYSPWDPLFLGTAAIGTGLSGWLLFRNRIRSSAILLLSIAWFSTTLFLITRGGIRIPVSQFYALIIVATTFLIGRRVGLIVAILSALTALAIARTELLGIIPSIVSAPPVLAYLVVHLLFLILITTITYLIAADVHGSFSTALASTAKAQERHQAVEQYAHELEAVNANLASSERRYRHFFNDTPVMMHSIDQQGILLDVNKTWLKMFGYRKEEVVGHRSTEFLTPESQRYAKEVALPAYFRDGFIKDIPYQMVKKNGEIIDVLLSGSKLVDNDGNFLHSLASIVDVTKQNRVEADLRESENRFRTLVNSAADCFLLLDAEGELIGVNDYTCQTTGYSRDELIGMPLAQFDAEWTPTRMHELAGQLERGVAATISSTLIHKNGNHIPVEIRAVVTTIENEPVFLGLARDVTEQNEAKAALQASEHRFRSIIFNQAQQFIGLLEPDGKLFEANQSALEFGQITKDDILGVYFWEAPWWNYDSFVQEQLINAVQIAAQGEQIQYEADVCGGDGALLTIDFSLTPIKNEANEVVWLLAEGRDITEIHQSRKDLEQSVREKELLLKEIHHRVKNNLQVVSSILRLQTNKTDDDITAAALNESQARIRSMQLIHEQLYQSDNLSHVNLADYCKRLTVEASRLYRASSTKIDFQLNLADLKLDIDRATTCGLIMHELISNSLKYAFPEDSAGTIVVEVARINDTHARLSVSDNGIGISPDIPFPNPSSLGFRLVQLLSAQLSAQVTLTREPNTKFELVFSLN